MKSKQLIQAFAAAAVFALGGTAFAAQIVTCPAAGTPNDLTTADQTATINGAIYRSADTSGSVGTGVFPAFVKINGNADCVQGYNTDGALEFDTNNSPILMFTLDTMAVVTQNNTDYVEFFLDINQTKDEPLLSLDNVQIFVSTSNTLTGYTDCHLGGPGGVDCVYNMDAGTNQTVLLNYTLNNGSGNGYDMSLLVPTSVFGSASGSSYVYLYSAFGSFGGHYVENDGPEEWNYRNCSDGAPCYTPPQGDCNPATQVCTPTVPEPGTLALIGASLLSGVALRRRERHVR